MNSGLGIRPEFFEQILMRKPALGFLEAHSENYFGDSLSRAKLLELRKHYLISLHGVGLSLGRADDLDVSHLQQLKRLVDDVEPMLVSEHLAWSAYSHRHIPDLLPLPLTAQALNLMCLHIEQMQQVLGRQVLIENPSNYLVFDTLQIPEPDFLNTLAARTGCGLLVDVNNIHVSAVNVGRDPYEYISALDSSAIGQYHLAGYTEVQKVHDGRSETLLIDTHNQTVYQPVWELFEAAVAQHGVKPTLFEWDSDFPELEVLLAECAKADQLLQSTHTAEQITESVKVENPDKNQQSDETLADLQTEFLNDVVALSGEHGAVKIGHEHRISVYQNNFFGAMQDYLADVYPATKGVVGDDFFRQMVQLTVQSQAPDQGNLHLFGDQLIDVAGRLEGLESLPYLPDLLHYEWALHRAYYSDVLPVLEPESMTQEDLLKAPLNLCVSARVIKSQFPIYEIHRQSLPSYQGEVQIDLAQSQDTILVHKQDLKVRTYLLSDDQWTLLKELQKHGNLLQAIESCSGSIEGNELSACLSFLFAEQLLRLATTEQPEPSKQEAVLH